MGSPDLSAIAKAQPVDKDWAEFYRMKYMETLIELRNANKGIARMSRRLRRREEYGDWLKGLTGISTRVWGGQLEMLVAKHSIPADDAPQRTYLYAVYAELLDYVRSALRKQMGLDVGEVEKFDMNIATARVLSGILSAWTIAVSEAKSFDSKRKIEDRKKMLISVSEWRREAARALLLQPQIRELWEQDWQNPFAKTK
jgi:hypothetical protein